MEVARGRGRLSPCLLAPLFGLLAGCGLGRPAVDQTLLARKLPAAPPAIRASYVVHFPDVLDVVVAGRPDWSGRRPLRPDGCIEAAAGIELRVEGRTTAIIARLLAQRAGVGPDRVGVTVAEYHSQQIFLFGQVEGGARAVSYQGPETVLEMFQRAGGITAGAAPNDIQVVRGHVADGRAPETFDVDLESILFKNNQASNVRLQPFDQVYVGQSRRASLVRCLPPWLRPLYKDLCGLSRPAIGRLPSPQEPRPAQPFSVQHSEQPVLNR
jgi:protein involved in polysaccharide export with SLBB domain